MKINKLLEMPVLFNKELSDSMNSFFIPKTRLNDHYKEFKTDTNLRVFLKLDLSRAYIGFDGIRHDGIPGVSIIGELEFHKDIRLSKFDKLNFTKVLQVSMVQIADDIKMRGCGKVLYQTLVKAGYTIISDNVHYEGGKALWKSLASSIKANEAIYIADNGTILTSSMNDPIMYNGSNVLDNVIWSGDDQKRFVVLIYTQTRNLLNF